MNLMVFRVAVCGLLLLGYLAGFPKASSAQGGGRLTRQQFSRMTVIERAARFEQAIRTTAMAEGVDPNLLWTIAYNETRFRPWLTSSKGAKGMMQFMPATAARFDLHDPFEPIAAIGAASRYVKYLSGMFGGRIDSVLAAYNAGEGTVSAYMQGRTVRSGNKIINGGGRRTTGGVPPYHETIGYVGRGLKVYKWLESRKKFSDSSVSASFPSVVAASVARIPLVDPELGRMPAFIEPKAAEPRVVRITHSSGNVVTRRDPEKALEPPPLNSSEIYYNPRSGNRFLYNAGGSENMIKLPLDGPVIVSHDTRTGISSRARTTFVAVPAMKSSIF